MFGKIFYCESMIRNIVNLSIKTIKFMKLAACHKEPHYSRIINVTLVEHGVLSLSLYLCFVLISNAVVVVLYICIQHNSIKASV